eukprot:3578115-Pyramimonas_sp.AAC.1
MENHGGRDLPEVRMLGAPGARDEPAFWATTGSLARLCCASMEWVIEAMTRIQRTMREHPLGDRLREWAPRCLSSVPAASMPAQPPAARGPAQSAQGPRARCQNCFEGLQIGDMEWLRREIG